MWFILPKVMVSSSIHFPSNDLVFISFMAKDGEHFFTYILALYISFENGLINSFAHKLVGSCDLLAFN
jgi:hypothetical protein